MAYRRNFRKTYEFLKEIFKDDEEYQRKRTIFEILDRQVRKIMEKQDKEFYLSSLLISNSYRAMFLPSLEKIEKKIEELKKSGQEKEAKKLNRILQELPIETGAVTKGLWEEMEILEVRPIYIVSEKFFDAILDYIGFDDEFEDFFIKNKYVLWNFYNENQKINKLFKIYQFLKLHEIAGHLRSDDLKKKFSKLYPQLSNIVHDLRIHALKEGIVFPSLYKEFVEFFKNGIYAHTFRQTMLYFDVLYDLIKNKIYDPEDAYNHINDKFKSFFVDENEIIKLLATIDFDKLKNEDPQDLIKEIDNLIKDYLEYYFYKDVINKDNFSLERLPLEIIEDFLNKFRDYTKNKGASPYTYKFEKIFEKLAELNKYLKGEGGGNGKGRGRGKEKGR